MPIGAELDGFGQQDSSLVIHCDGEKITWQQLLGLIYAAEHFLLAHSKVQDIISLQLNNPAEALIFFLACSRRGRIAMMLDPGSSLLRQQQISAHIQTHLVINDALAEQLLAQPKSVPAEALTDENGLFYLGFTSGSSGTPKAFWRRQSSWQQSMIRARQIYPMPRAQQVIISGSLYQSLHLYTAVEALCHGASIALSRHFSPSLIAANIASSGKFVSLVGTPLQHTLIARATGDFTQLRQVLIGGSSWSGDAYQHCRKCFANADFIEYFGSSELNFITIQVNKQRGVGRVFPGVELRIIDTNNQNCAPGQTGRIFVRSDLVFEGYVFGVGKEFQRLDDWFSIGDLGYLDTEQYLHLDGRNSRMIIINGLNVFAEEIENTLIEACGINQAAVIGINDDLRGQRIIAFVVSDTGTPPTALALKQLCQQHVGSNFGPQQIYFVSALPMTASGKIDYPALIRQAEEAHE